MHHQVSAGSWRDITSNGIMTAHEVNAASTATRPSTALAVDHRISRLHRAPLSSANSAARMTGALYVSCDLGLGHPNQWNLTKSDGT
jgi:hypothetical protein